MANLTVKEAASEFGVTPTTIRRWIAQRLLGHVRLGPRAVRIPREEIDRMNRENTIPAVHHGR
jgi:excisionase family DNA binding protein